MSTPSASAPPQSEHVWVVLDSFNPAAEPVPNGTVVGKGILAICATQEIAYREALEYEGLVPHYIPQKDDETMDYASYDWTWASTAKEPSGILAARVHDTFVVGPVRILRE